MKIVIYSTHTCAFCKTLKEYLDKNNFKYEVKYADDDPKLAQELFEKSQQLGVPYTIITDESGNESKILGFDKSKIDSALNIT